MIVNKKSEKMSKLKYLTGKDMILILFKNSCDVIDWLSFAYD